MLEVWEMQDCADRIGLQARTACRQGVDWQAWYLRLPGSCSRAAACLLGVTGVQIAYTAWC